MNTETKHTPTPYRMVENAGLPEGNKTYWAIEGGRGYFDRELGQGFCLTSHMTEQDAAFIVRACNSHAALVKALDLMIHQYEQICEDNNVMGFPAALAMAKAALAGAE